MNTQTKCHKEKNESNCQTANIQISTNHCQSKIPNTLHGLPLGNLQQFSTEIKHYYAATNASTQNTAKQ